MHLTVREGALSRRLMHLTVRENVADVRVDAATLAPECNYRCTGGAFVRHAMRSTAEPYAPRSPRTDDVFAVGVSSSLQGAAPPMVQRLSARGPGWKCVTSKTPSAARCKAR